MTDTLPDERDSQVGRAIVDVFHRHLHDLPILDALGQFPSPDAVIGQVRKRDDAFGGVPHEAVEVVGQVGVEKDQFVCESLPFQHTHLRNTRRRR